MTLRPYSPAAAPVLASPPRRFAVSPTLAWVGVVFAALYAKYGLAPVGPVSTGPSIVDKKNIDKILKVFDTYPNVIGSK